MRSFQGLITFDRKIIKDFSTIIAPLIDIFKIFNFNKEPLYKLILKSLKKAQLNPITNITKL